jgi:hypothetical protein
MILKKQISILLTFLLLVSNLGLAFNVHYCADEIESITINLAPASAKVVDVCCGIVEEEPGCCKDKIIKAEIKSELIIIKAVSFDTEFIEDYNCWKPFFFSNNLNFKTRGNFTYYCDSHPPPLYLLYSQYTFYA